VINDIAVITYTNSNCHDILLPHSRQLSKFAGQIKSYILTDKNPEFDLEEHQVIIYDNKKQYYEQWLDCLKNVKENYFVYLQEDFFLYENVNYNELIRCKEFLNNSSYDFVRHSKFELRRGIHDHRFKLKEFPDVILDDKIFDAYTLDEDCFGFMMQATLWKNKSFQSLYEHVKSEKWLESVEWDKGIRDLKIKGAYYHDSSSLKMGAFHWESKMWPHICTAVGKGKWNISHHQERLIKLLNQYKIDISIRGSR
jgi:hypothetical protein